MAESPRQEADSGTDSSDKEFSCPKCGDVFDSERGMKIHYGTSHDGSIAKTEFECDYCGELETKYDSEYGNGKGDFCSRECAYKWLSDYRDEKTEVECANCGEPKRVRNYELEHRNNFFCDKDCFGTWWSENRRGENHPNWRGDELQLTCEWCGDSYRTQEQFLDISRFCGAECHAEWMSENQVGENAPAWEGGYDGYYGPNWDKQRSKAWRRDQYRCQVCSKPESQIGSKPHAHHIKPMWWFKENFDDPEWYEKGNKLSNLICLCKKHHRNVEGWNLSPDVR